LTPLQNILFITPLKFPGKYDNIFSMKNKGQKRRRRAGRGGAADIPSASFSAFRIPYIQFSMLMLCLKGMKNFVKVGDLRTRRERGNRMGRGA
jgi:hypothetical protein